MSPRLNLLAPEFRANPYPFYAELRRQAPVSQVDPGDMWAVSRYDDVLTVCKNPQLYSSAAIVESGKSWLEFNPLADSVLLMDPPRHTRLRALINRAFGPPALARLEPRIRDVARTLTDELLQRRTVDFIEALALPLPASVIALLLGLDVSLRDKFKHWGDALVSAPAIADTDVELREQARATVGEMERYLRGVLEERRRHPGDDLVSDLLRAQVDGESLEDRELMGFLTLLLVAGLETTVHLLSGSARVLSTHPELLVRLRQDPPLIPRFVEEVLRYESPVQGVLRVTRAETTLGGVRLPQGARVLMLLGSANRDEAHFPEPDRFSLERSGGAPNLAFGQGIHFCLGAQLARLDTRLALETLLPQCSKLVPGVEPLDWNMSITVRGPSRLTLEAIRG